MKSILFACAAFVLAGCETLPSEPQRPLTYEEAQMRMEFMQRMMQMQQQNLHMQQQNLWNVVRPLPAPVVPTVTPPVRCTSSVIGNQIYTNCN
jgi:hypothetical protein